MLFPLYLLLSFVSSLFQTAHSFPISRPFFNASRAHNLRDLIATQFHTITLVDIAAANTAATVTSPLVGDEQVFFYPQFVPLNHSMVPTPTAQDTQPSPSPSESATPPNNTSSTPLVMP